MGSVRQTIAAILALSFSLSGTAGVEAGTNTVIRRPAPQAAAKKGCDFSAAYNAYLGRLQNKVLARWNTLLADGKNSVTLAATVATDGSVTSVNVRSAPNNPAAEQSALDAFNNSQPLESLPSGSSPVVITFTFVSTSDPHGDSNSSMSARMAPVTAPSASAPPSSNYQPPTSSTYEPPASTSASTPSSTPASTAASPPASSTPVSTNNSYPAAGGMPADLGLGSVLPPDQGGGLSATPNSAAPAQTTTPAPQPSTVTAPAGSSAAPAAEPAPAAQTAAPVETAPAATAPAATSDPAAATPAVEAAPAGQAAPPAAAAPAVQGQEAVTAPESVPSSTPIGGATTPESSSTPSGDSFTPSEQAPQSPQGSEGAATYGSPGETTP